MATLTVLCGICLLMLASMTVAYPSYYVVQGSTSKGPKSVKCISHPAQKWGPHGAAVVDRTSSLVIIPPAGRPNPEVTKSVCKGVSGYRVKVTFANSPKGRHALLTASAGALATSLTYKEYTNIWSFRRDACATKRLVVQRTSFAKVKTFSTTYFVPAAAPATKVQFNMTSAATGSMAFQAYSKTYSIVKCATKGR